MSEINDRIAVWNERYSRGEGVHDNEPSPPLPLAVTLAEPGLALDLAAGAGRHAVYLAERGWRVVAVEGSSVGVGLMSDQAERRGVSASIDARCADLEATPRGFALEPGAYDLVCDFYFLDRSLFEEIREAVRPGGLFVAAIHVEDPEGSEGRFLLAPGELEAMAREWGWDVLHSHEGSARESGHRHGTAELVARRRL